MLHVGKRQRVKQTVKLLVFIVVARSWQDADFFLDLQHMLTVLQHKHLRHHRASMRLSNKQANRQSVDAASVWLLTTTLKTQFCIQCFY